MVVIVSIICAYRAKYGFDTAGSFLTDLVVTFCCPTCALVQNSRELIAQVCPNRFPLPV